MNNRNLELFLCNNKILESVGGFFTNNDLKKCNALSLTLKNQKADADRINEAIKIIKKSQSAFSNFRGNNLLIIATRISFEIDMQSSFDQIDEIYIKLNKHFFKNEYLVLTAQLIYDSRNIIDIETTIINTRKAYDYMKKNHMFLTGSEDVSAAAMIAITKTDFDEAFDEAFDEIEESYKLLKNKGFWTGNNLQSLSHVLVLFNGSV